MGSFFDSAFFGPVRRRYVIMRAPRLAHTIALTFDDGPDPVNTPKLLALLKDANVTATFFFSGLEMERFPDLVRQTARRGHEIGNHCYSHKTMEELGFKEYAKEMKRTGLLIEKYSGRSTALFRPPYGERGFKLLWLMACRRMKSIIWSVDHHDYRFDDKKILVRLMQETPLHSGDILLFHETNRATIEAMPEIIADISSRCFSLTTVSRLLRKPAARPVEHGLCLPDEDEGLAPSRSL